MHAAHWAYRRTEVKPISPKEPDVSRDVPFRDLKKGIQEQKALSL
jgi:hypothetical protein